MTVLLVHKNKGCKGYFLRVYMYVMFYSAATITPNTNSNCLYIHLFS
jgi:hypothetical protein